jgi:hypothetical protein
MEPIESSETSAYINTLTPATYPKEKKLQSKHGESLKSSLEFIEYLSKNLSSETDFMGLDMYVVNRATS